ncbi:MAG: hypothetical protein AABW89_06105 [Nanoarchaeota archaeon]
MSKIKEIRKITSSIKEIPKKKVESLDDEFSEEDETQHFLPRFRKSAGGSTLESEDISHNIVRGERAKSGEDDEKEIHFRPSYTGASGNPYQGSNYTPVGSSESATSAGGKNLDRPDLDRGRTLRSENSVGMQQTRGEINPERSYAGEGEQTQSDRREKRRMM